MKNESDRLLLVKFNQISLVECLLPKYALLLCISIYTFKISIFDGSFCAPMSLPNTTECHSLIWV